MSVLRSATKPGNPYQLQPQWCFLSLDISPADLDALWSEPPYTLNAANEIFTGNDIMTTGNGIIGITFCVQEDQLMCMPIIFQIQRLKDVKG